MGSFYGGGVLFVNAEMLLGKAEPRRYIQPLRRGAVDSPFYSIAVMDDRSMMLNA